jgi:hypothetical protein
MKKGKVRENGLGILRQTKLAKVGRREVNRLQTSLGGTISQPGRTTSTRLCLEPLMSSVFTLFCSSWPKTNYKKGPMGVPERRRQRNMKNTKHRLLRVAGAWLEGEPLPELPQSTSPPSPTSPHCSLIRLKRIYNFLCSMLVFHYLLSVLLHFVAFLCIFRN